MKLELTLSKILGNRRGFCYWIPWNIQLHGTQCKDR